ncbi:MAG: hypothetical protein WDA16_10330 [Candidatus Thermoplasmatota archaeon]
MSYGGAAGPAIRRNIERGQEADERGRLNSRIQRFEAQIRALGHEPVA